LEEMTKMAKANYHPAVRFNAMMVVGDLNVRPPPPREDPKPLPEALPILDAERQPIGVVLVLHDVTRIRQQDEIKRNVIATVSHQLKTPLTSIKGAMQLLLHDESLVASEDHRQLVGVALNNTERLIRIVNDMLDVAKIEAGRLNLQRRPTAVGDLVRTSVQNVEQIARGAGVRLVADVAEGLPALDVDPDRMVQALVNLLSNALKFAPDGSDVTIAAQPSPEGQVTLSVRDRGPGIPAEQASRLFQKFQQLDGGGARKFRGTGLGLAITRGLVEQHGGRIDVQSAPGEGTTFRITMAGA